MSSRLRLYHKLFPFVFIPVCLFLIINFGWTGFVTLTERPGLYGDWYMYYKVSRPLFYGYCFLVAGIAFILVCLQVKYLFSGHSKYLNRTFLALVIFLLLVIIAEVCLQLRFEGKS